MAACASFRESIAAAVYQDLAPAERPRLDAHLASCAACRAHLDELRETAALLGLDRPGPTEAEEAQLFAAVERRLERAAPRRRTVRAVTLRRRFNPAWAVAAALFVAVVGLSFLTRPREEKTAEVAEVEAPKPPPPDRPRDLTPPAPPPKPVAPPAEPAPTTPAPTTPEPRPALPPAPEPPPPLASERKTVAVAATLESVVGEVYARRDDQRVPVKAGQGIAPGDGLSTSDRKSLAVFKFADGTRVEVGPETTLRDVREGEGGRGKGLFLAQGSVRAQVARQPHPMVLSTEHGLAKVVGTRLRLEAAPNATRLEVTEGRVHLARDAEEIEVGAGQFAVAAPGLALASRPLRASNGLLALYRFEETSGGWVRDGSGAGLPLDLRIDRPKATAWKSPGLAVESGTRIISPGPASKVIDACRASGELSVEAWVRPAVARPAREGAIVSLAQDVPVRNFSLLHSETYSAYFRTTETDPTGRPVLAVGKEWAEPRLTHLVYVRASSGTEIFYVNGLERASQRRPGTTANWDEGLRLILGNEETEERPWLGEYRLVALYGRALEPTEVARNFKLGVD